MEELANNQQATGNEIQRIIDNFKKDPAARKTLPYYEERLRRLEGEWEKFDATDSDIRNYLPPQLDHPYFTKGYYDVVKTAYCEYKDTFTDKIVQIQRSAKDEKSQDHTTDRSDPIHRRQQYEIEMLRRKLTKSDGMDGSKHFWNLRRSTILQHWTRIQATHMSMIEDDEVTPRDETTYIEIEEAVERALIQCAQEVEGPVTQQGQHNPESQSQFILPKVSLPKFNGDYLAWRQFYDLFTQMIDNQDMPQCQKMWYLKGNLTGEAEKMIRHLPLTDDSYSSAWKMLQDRYNNERLLTTTLFNRLLQQPNQVNESASGIKALHDTIIECMQGLKNLGIDTKS